MVHSHSGGDEKPKAGVQRMYSTVPGQGREVYIQARCSGTQSEVCCLLHSTQNQTGFQSIYLGRQAADPTAQDGLSSPQEIDDRTLVLVQAPFGRTETIPASHQTVRRVNMRRRAE